MWVQDLLLTTAKLIVSKNCVSHSRCLRAAHDLCWQLMLEAKNSKAMCAAGALIELVTSNPGEVRYVCILSSSSIPSLVLAQK